MTRLPKLSLVVGALVVLTVFFTLTLTGCDGGGPDQPPDSDHDGIPDARDACPNDPTNTCDDPPKMVEYTITLDLSPDEAVATTDNGQSYTDGDELTREEGTEVTFTVTADGYEPTERTVTFDRDRTVTIALEREAVTITIGATLDTDVIVGDGPYEVEITSADGSVQQSKPLRDLLDAPLTIELPKASEQVTLSARVKYGTYKFDYAAFRLAKATLDFTPDRDRNVTLALSTLIACADGIDNDHEDGGVLIDVEDPGCVGDDGTYDPDDDVERLKGWRVTGFGYLGDDTLFVSSDRDHWRLDFGSNNYPEHIQIAVAVRAGTDLRVEDDQTDEGLAAKFSCGPDSDHRNNINVTGIIADDPSFDGWRYASFPDIGPAFFTTGGNCGITFLHQQKARGLPPGDGNDDVVLRVPSPPDNTTRFSTAWLFEPEEVPDEDPNGSALRTQSHAAQVGCRETVHGRVCTDVQPNATAEWLRE